MRVPSLLLIAALVLAGGRAAAAPETPPLDRPVSFEFQDADLRDAVRVILDSAGADYVLPVELAGTVTATFSDVPARHALSSLLRSRGWMVNVDGRQVTLAPRRTGAPPVDLTSLPPATTPLPAGVSTVSSSGRHPLHVIRLRFLDAAYVAALISGGGLVNGLSATSWPPQNAVLAAPIQAPAAPLYAMPGGIGR